MKGSLLAAIDLTVSSAGGRLLAARIGAPLAAREAITKRLDLVSWYHDRPSLCDELRSMMKGQPDIDRALSRLSMGHGGPRDLQALSQALTMASDLVGTATRAHGLGDLAELAALHDAVMAPVRLASELAPALADELPLLARDGGFVRGGFDVSLDELRALRDESRRLIAALQHRYCEATGIASLKIKHNNVLGYHVDVRSAHAEKLMQDEQFIHRQTTAQTVRFTTTELAELERDLSTAADRALARELEIFESLRAQALAEADQLGAAARALAACPALASVNFGSCPKLTDEAARVLAACPAPVSVRRF